LQLISENFAPTAKDAVLSPGCNDAFSGSRTQSVQRLWSFRGFPAIAVAGEGIKGFI